MQETTYQPISSASLHCPFNSPWSFFCFTKTCQNSALLCGNPQCPCTSSHHKNCSICFGNPILQQVQSRRKYLSEQVDTAFQEVQAIYNEMIQKLSIEREKLQLAKAHGGLSQEQILFLEALQGRRFGDVTGELVSKVKDRAEKKEGAFKGLNREYVKKIWKRHKDNFQSIVSQLSVIVQPDNVIISLLQDFDELKTQKQTSAQLKGHSTRSTSISSGASGLSNLITQEEGKIRVIQSQKLIYQLESQLKKCQCQIRDLEQNTKYKEKEIKNYQKQVQSLEVRLNSRQSQLNDLKARSEEIHKFSDSPDSKARILTQQVRQLQDVLVDMKEKYMKSQERVELLQHENKQLKKKIDGSSGQHDQHNTISKLEKQIQIMKSELEILQQNLMSKDMLLRMETKRCEELKTQITRK